MKYRDFKDLIAYQKGFTQAMNIFQLSAGFPVEERYSLTDQIRRSSRSICTNMAEAYRKRAYPKHFHSKMTDCWAENGETGRVAPKPVAPLAAVSTCSFYYAAANTRQRAAVVGLAGRFIPL